jgi:hypothetical protein
MLDLRNFRMKIYLDENKELSFTLDKRLHEFFSNKL